MMLERGRDSVLTLASRGAEVGEEMYLGQVHSVRHRSLSLLCMLLCATGLLGSYGPVETEEFKTRYPTRFTSTEDSNEKQLISDLHVVLERLKNNRFPSLGKKHNYVPMCDPGEQCATRKGSRIGKLCDCFLPRRCNSFLHRCL